MAGWREMEVCAHGNSLSSIRGTCAKTGCGERASVLRYGARYTSMNSGDGTLVKALGGRDDSASGPVSPCSAICYQDAEGVATDGFGSTRCGDRGGMAGNNEQLCDTSK